MCNHALFLYPLNVVLFMCIIGQMAVVYQPCQSTTSSASSTAEHPHSMSSSSISSSSSQQDNYTFRHHPSSSCENGSDLPSPDATLALVTLRDVLSKILTNPKSDNGSFCGVLVHCPYSESSSVENERRSPVWMSQQRISNRTSSSSTVV